MTCWPDARSPGGPAISAMISPGFARPPGGASIPTRGFHLSASSSRRGSVVRGLDRPGARGRSRRVIISAAIVALLVAVLASLAISVAAASQITQPHHTSISDSTARTVADFEDAAFLSRVDHLHLKGWLFKVAARSNRRSAIIVHGHDANRVNPDWGTLAMTKDLMSQGMDVLAFDLRGVGESEGDHQTFGNLE